MGDENEEMEIDEPTSSGGERKRFEVKKVLTQKKTKKRKMNIW